MVFMYFCVINWNFEYTKAVIYTVVKVGGDTGQDPATEVTHLTLNQPPVFSSDRLVFAVHMSPYAFKA